MNTNKTEQKNLTNSILIPGETRSSSSADKGRIKVDGIEITPVLDIITNKYEMVANMQDYIALDSKEIVYSEKKHEKNQLILVAETNDLMIFKYAVKTDEKINLKQKIYNLFKIKNTNKYKFIYRLK